MCQKHRCKGCGRHFDNLTGTVFVGAVAAQPEMQLAGEIGCDEVYMVVGHKGHPGAVVNKGRRGRRLKGSRDVVWSLLRSWLRPHRGISQEKMPLYLGFFLFMHNARQRGIGLLELLLGILLTPADRNP